MARLSLAWLRAWLAGAAERPVAGVQPWTTFTGAFTELHRGGTTTLTRTTRADQRNCPATILASQSKVQGAVGGRGD